MHNFTFINSFLEMENFLRAVHDISKFTLEQVDLATQREWSIDSGAMSHSCNGFFHVCGIESKVTAQQKLVLYQPQSALTGLAFYQKNGLIYVLLQARVEPGNTNVVQFGPTIQSTPANYLKLHGGKETSCTTWFTQYSKEVTPLSSSMQFDLGERYFQKSKWHNYVELSSPVIDDQSMVWVSIEALREALSTSNFLNADLRSLLAVFDWNLILGKQCDLKPTNNTKVMFDVTPKLNFSNQHWKWISLDNLKSWQVSSSGIIDTAEQGYDVKIYKTGSLSREVSQWYQPLMRASSSGLVRLYLRKSGDSYECLVTIAWEFGISGGKIVHPSYVIYPGKSSKLPPAYSNATELASFYQSDEGGRFIEHESLYQVLLVDQFEACENQYWISMSSLASLMRMSNTTSIQLRTIASSILPFIYDF